MFFGSFADGVEHWIIAWGGGLSHAGIRPNRSRLEERWHMYRLNVHFGDDIAETILCLHGNGGRWLGTHFIRWDSARHSNELHGTGGRLPRLLALILLLIYTDNGIAHLALMTVILVLILWLLYLRSASLLEVFIVRTLYLLHVQLDCLFVLAYNCRILRNWRSVSRRDRQWFQWFWQFTLFGWIFGWFCGDPDGSLNSFGDVPGIFSVFIVVSGQGGRRGHMACSIYQIRTKSKRLVKKA